ncbi:MAG: thiazole synthase [Alphaproteobacteria bacterium]|nr:thiazole synthase [Alphaproteobacteria bacterium]MCB9699835.1 thiazole synthase [Alphaproteobacteria bacterium]
MWKLGSVELSSRLVVGTGRYADFEQMRRCHETSGTQMVTVALRRVDLDAPDGVGVLDHIDRERIHLLPNTSGCWTAEDAVVTARLGRELLGTDLVKLEVIGCERTLWPDVEGTLEAARILVREGFQVLPYCTDDPVVCRRLEDLGCAAVMPLAAPIGSGLGIRNPTNLMIVREQITIPLIVDAGVGTASDAALAMELGADGVLMNTAIAAAKDPVRMAEAMRYAVIAGRAAFEAGRMEKRLYATASSPIDGRIGT